MTLQPTQPPGRRSRKARAFAGDIARLRALGYSQEGIREALAEAGVVVSRGTVRRELMRPPAVEAPSLTSTPPSTSIASPREAALPVPAKAQESAISSPPLPTAIRAPTSKEIAAEFMKGRHTNPLFRNRS
jgi:hypothetical protein